MTHALFPYYTNHKNKKQYRQHVNTILHNFRGAFKQNNKKLGLVVLY